MDSFAVLLVRSILAIVGAITDPGPGDALQAADGAVAVQVSLQLAARRRDASEVGGGVKSHLVGAPAHKASVVRVEADVTAGSREAGRADWCLSRLVAGDQEMLLLPSHGAQVMPGYLRAGVADLHPEEVGSIPFYPEEVIILDRETDNTLVKTSLKRNNSLVHHVQLQDFFILNITNKDF